MPGTAQYGKGGRKNPDIQPHAHEPGYKWDQNMGIWYKPLKLAKNKSDKLKIS